MISISAFIISLSGIISLLYLRLWEIRRGSRLYNFQREKLDEKVVSLGEYLRHRIPTFDRSVVSRMYHTTIHYFALMVLSILRIIERRMVSLLEHVRGKREVTRGVTQSDFLKQVGSHKRRLEKPSKDAIQ